MDEKELQKIIEAHSSDFKICVENESFSVDATKIVQTDNPIQSLLQEEEYILPK